MHNYHIQPICVVGIFCAFLLSTITHAAGMSPKVPTKANKEKTYLDPTLKDMRGQLVFDTETKAAFVRSKEKDELLAAEEKPGHIYRIRFKGAKKVESDAVALRLVSKIGHMYDPVLIAADIREIYKMGLFSNIEVFKEQLPSGAYLVEYRMTENPTIFQIGSKGNKALNDEEIKEALAALENYQGATKWRLQSNAEKVRDLYISKGYFLAEVNYEISKTSEKDIAKREKEGLSQSSSSKGPAVDIDTAQVRTDDFVDVTFKIKENNKVKVNRIYFLGNSRISDEEIRPFLRTHENHALSLLNDMGTFRKDYLEIDTLIIEKLVHDKGMLKAKILPPLVQLSPDKTTIEIGYQMIEGEQYSLGSVAVEGDKIESSETIYRLQKEANPDEPLFYADKLLKEIAQKPGDVFNKSMMAENILAIAEKYRDAGYAYANISPIPTFDEESKEVHIKIAIESGPRVKIERIDIVGNEKTKDEVIRRELDILEGDFYSSTGLRLSENNVVRLGYFENVEMTNGPGSRPDTMVVTIKVSEKSTGNVQAGAGYGTGGEGLVLRGQVSNHNLFGRGQTLSAQINYSNFRQEFDVMFIEPYLSYIFSNPLTFAFTAYNRERMMGEFTRSAIGGDFTLGYPIGAPLSFLSRKWKSKAKPSLVNYVIDFEALSLYLTYTVERVEIRNITTDARNWGLYEGVPLYTTSIRPSLRWDQRDNRLFPTRGMYAEFRVDFASEYLGGIGLAKLENYIRKGRENNRLKDGLNYMKPLSEANNFIKYGANFRIYHNLDDWFFLKGFVLKANFEMGILDTLGRPLLFENYALGGPNSLRGYSYRSISPVERTGALFPFDARRDLLVGGNKQFLGSVELEFPLINSLKLGGVVFFDFGNAYSEEDNFFFIGGKSENAKRIHPSDPLRLYEWLGLYSSVGFGLRWQSPIGYLRFEWGIPLNRRPSTTPGLGERDRPISFEFSIGPSF